MRLRLALVSVMCVALPALARPRTQVTFAAGKGGEAVAYFAPEVARTVSERLEAAGVEPAADVAIAGHIDELPGERVRLTATVHGHSVSVEGSIENLDGVAAQLASRLVPLVGEGAAHKVAVARKTDAVGAAPPPATSTEKSAAEKSTGPRSAPLAAADKTPGEKPPAGEKPAAPSEKSAVDRSTATAAAEKPAAEKVAPERSAGDKSAAEAASSSAPATTSPSAPATTSPSAPATASAGGIGAPSGAMPTAMGAPAPQPNPYPAYRQPPQIGGFPRTQPVVVAHQVPDSPSAFAGNGISATQALYYFLGKRLGMLVVPGGVGLAPPQIAAAEAWRAQARAVVMAHIEAVDYTQTQTGPGLRCRLEVMVVREGRMVLRRVVESPPAAATPPPTGLRRGRELDPMFVAVSQALDALGPEIGAAIVQAR